MSVEIQNLSWDQYCAAQSGSSGSIFLTPGFVQSNQHKTNRLEFISAQNGKGKPLSLFPVDIDKDRANLTFSASFTDFGFADLKIMAAMEFCKAVIDWCLEQGCTTITVTLPPTFYGNWVALMRFALRCNGFQSNLLTLAAGLTKDRLAGMTGFSKRLRSYNNSLTRRGLAVSEPEDPAASLRWVGAYYQGRGREMSVAPEQLLEYHRAGMPLRIFDVLDNTNRVFSVVFYQFREVLLYMFAARSMDMIQSPFSWLLAQTPALAMFDNVQVIDLGNVANTTRDLEWFHQSGVANFKDRLGPIYCYRELLQWRLTNG